MDIPLLTLYSYKIQTLGLGILDLSIRRYNANYAAEVVDTILRVNQRYAVQTIHRRLYYNRKLPTRILISTFLYSSRRDSDNSGYTDNYIGTGFT